MNLFYNPSLSQLSPLIAGIANYDNIYDILVEHDGEVLIGLSFSNPAAMADKYKFYFRGLNGKDEIGIFAARNLEYLNGLYNSLNYCWENNLTGAIDYDEILSIQTLSLWLELNKISTSFGTKNKQERNKQIHIKK